LVWGDLLDDWMSYGMDVNNEVGKWWESVGKVVRVPAGFSSFGGCI